MVLIRPLKKIDLYRENMKNIRYQI